MSAISAIGNGAPNGPGIPPGFGKRRRGVRVTTAAVVALGLTLAAPGAVGAATTTTSSGSGGSTPNKQMGVPPRGGKQPTAFGTVKSVGTDSFTLTGRDGTVTTVDVTSATTYKNKGVSSATLADVTVGAHVAVFGTEASGTVTATSVALGLPGGGGPGGKGGSGGPAGGRTGRPPGKTGSGG